MSTHDENSSPIKPKRSRDTRAPASPVPTFDLRDLLGGGREAVLIHGDDHYRLRVTANNKLILTK